MSRKKTKQERFLEIKPQLLRTHVSVSWTTTSIKRLLYLIENSPRYRLAFFPQGLVKHKVCDIARELCIELMEDEPEYMAMLEGRKQVKRDKKGNWIPTETWTSSWNNPVVTKYHDLKNRFKVVTDKFGIDEKWTSLQDVPTARRKEFHKTCPWYFDFKALNQSSQADTGSDFASSSPSDLSPSGDMEAPDNGPIPAASNAHHHGTSKLHTSHIPDINGCQVNVEGDTITSPITLPNKPGASSAIKRLRPNNAPPKAERGERSRLSDKQPDSSVIPKLGPTPQDGSTRQSKFATKNDFASAGPSLSGRSPLSVVEVKLNEEQSMGSSSAKLKKPPNHDTSALAPSSEAQSKKKAKLLMRLRDSTVPHGKRAKLVVFQYDSHRLEEHNAAAKKGQRRVLEQVQLHSALKSIGKLLKHGMLPRCFLGHRLLVGPAPLDQDRDTSRRLCKYARIAGAGICSDIEQLLAGDPRETRCQVSNELKGYMIGPDTFPPSKIGGQDPDVINSVRVQHYSILAFVRLFYERIYECSVGDNFRAVCPRIDRPDGDERIRP